jgi:hypothetical protein
MVSVNELAACGVKNCGNLVNKKKQMALSKKIAVSAKACLKKNKSFNKNKLTKCIKGSKEYKELQKVIEANKKVMIECMKKKCGSLRNRNNKSNNKRKTGSVKKGKSRKVRK